MTLFSFCLFVAGSLEAWRVDVTFKYHECESNAPVLVYSFSSEGGFTLQPSAASCDITPLELEMLLVLWILLYCCLILPQMNL